MAYVDMSGTVPSKDSFCSDAKRWLKIDVICGKGCPIVTKCPRLIMEDATDKAVKQAMKAMLAMLEAINDR